MHNRSLERERENLHNQGQRIDVDDKHSLTNLRHNNGNVNQGFPYGAHCCFPC